MIEMTPAQRQSLVGLVRTWRDGGLLLEHAGAGVIFVRRTTDDRTWVMAPDGVLDQVPCG